MDDFPRRVCATYNKKLGRFAIKALDGPKAGRVIDYVDDVYLGDPIGHPKSNRVGAYAPVTGTWLPSAERLRVRLSACPLTYHPTKEFIGSGPSLDASEATDYDQAWRKRTTPYGAYSAPSSAGGSDT